MKRGMVKLAPPKKIPFEKPSLIRVNILAESVTKLQVNKWRVTS